MRNHGSALDSQERDQEWKGGEEGARVGAKIALHKLGDKIYLMVVLQILMKSIFGIRPKKNQLMKKMVQAQLSEGKELGQKRFRPLYFKQ